MNRIVRLAAVALMVGLCVGHGSPTASAAAHPWLGDAPCDVLAKIHNTLTALGEDGTRWELGELDGKTGMAYADIDGSRVEIHTSCDQAL